MSVESDTNYISFVGNNSTVTPYAITTFFWFEDGDLTVTVVDLSGVATVLALNVDYTVSGSGNQNGGSIVTTEAVPVTSQVQVLREMDITQEAVYNENDAFPAAITQNALDKLTMICQQLSRLTSNGLRVIAGYILNPFQFVPNTVIGFGASQPTTLTPDQLLTFLGASSMVVTSSQPTVVFANAGVRASFIPNFTGQVGIQFDTKQIYISTGTSAGNWTLYVGATQSFADSTARGSAVPAFVGQLGVQLDTHATYNATGTSAGNWTQTTAANSIADASVTLAKLAASARVFLRGVYGLNITRPTTTAALVTIAEIVLPDASGNYLRFPAPSPITCTLTSSGANGLDTGSPAMGTFYFLWAIGSTDGTTLATLLSTSATAPTLPSGYTYKLLIGAYLTNSSSAFIFGYQDGTRMNCFSGTLSSFTYTSGTNVSIANFVPSTAKRVRCTVWSTASAKDLAVSVAGNNLSGAGLETFAARSGTTTVAGSNLGRNFSASFDVSLLSPSIFIQTSNHAYNLDITGWDLA